MSFFKKLFGRRSRGVEDYAASMIEMAAEQERTYLGMLELVDEEIRLGMIDTPPNWNGQVLPTAKGVYKARLLAALTVVVVHVKVERSASDSQDMLNAATGIALKPPGESLASNLERSEAIDFTMDFLIPAFKAMLAALDDGPWLPGSKTVPQSILSAHLHEAIGDSIGSESYTPEIRQRFDMMVDGNMANGLNHAIRQIG
jgi:hypothetical protein